MSNHVLFCGNGALQFAMQQGIQQVPFENLVTEKARRRLTKFPQYQPSVKVEFYEQANNESAGLSEDEHDTVGAVTIDASGNVAFATSTGGITAKQSGRVGDSPIVGSGGYADNAAGAVSTTGHGEALMRTCLAKHIAMLMQQGEFAQPAVDAGMKMLSTKVSGDGGCIAVDRSGNIGVSFNTEGMAWAYCRLGRLHRGIYPNELIEETL